MARRYDSTLRAEKAEQTRLGLLEATTGLLVEEGVEALSIPRVAARAGVSSPTAYKYFPTLEALLLAHLDHIRPQIGMSDADLSSLAVDEVARLPQRNFRRYEKHRDLLRAVMDSSVFQRVRRDSAAGRDRVALVHDAFAPHTTNLDRRELGTALAAIFLPTTPAAWRWFRDTWGLSAADATRAAAWVTSVLVRELIRNPDTIKPVDPVDHRE